MDVEIKNERVKNTGGDTNAAQESHTETGKI